jgi:hypothetical protein
VVASFQREDREVADGHQGEVVSEREEAHRAEPLEREEEEGHPLLLAAVVVPGTVEAR